LPLTMTLLRVSHQYMTQERMLAGIVTGNAWTNGHQCTYHCCIQSNWWYLVLGAYLIKQKKINKEMKGTSIWQLTWIEIVAELVGSSGRLGGVVVEMTLLLSLAQTILTTKPVTTENFCCHQPGKCMLQPHRRKHWNLHSFETPTIASSTCNHHIRNWSLITTSISSMMKIM
jgi:hypothetical protein